MRRPCERTWLNTSCDGTDGAGLSLRGGKPENGGRNGDDGSALPGTSRREMRARERPQSRSDVERRRAAGPVIVPPENRSRQGNRSRGPGRKAERGRQQRQETREVR